MIKTIVRQGVKSKYIKKRKTLLCETCGNPFQSNKNTKCPECKKIEYDKNYYYRNKLKNELLKLNYLNGGNR